MGNNVFPSFHKWENPISINPLEVSFVFLDDHLSESKDTDFSWSEQIQARCLNDCCPWYILRNFVSGVIIDNPYNLHVL